jgi:hypothetical protein
MPKKYKLHQINEAIEDLKKDHIGLGNILNPWITGDLNKRNDTTALCQVGSFIYNFDPKGSIISIPKPPKQDFIIEIQGKKIGLEHTRIMNKEKEGTYNSIQSLFDSAALKFKEHYPTKKICATIRLLNDTLEISKNSNRNELINEICSATYLESEGVRCWPNYITRIKVMPNEKISFSYLEDNFNGEKLSLNVLEERIKEKEIKLEKYYQLDKNIDTFWLLLMVGSLSSASYELDDTINYKLDSKFDKVFLKHDFEGTIVEVK